MFRICTENDRALVLDYISPEPETTLFIAGNIEGFGMEGLARFFVFERNGTSGPCAVVMRRADQFAVYSRDDSFDSEEIASLIDGEMGGRAPDDVNGAARTVGLLVPFFPDNHWEPCTLASCRRLATGMVGELPSGLTLGELGSREVGEWVSLLCSCEELSIDPSDADGLAARRRRKSEDLASGLACSVVRDEGGRIVSTASMGAASSRGAMIIAVATAPGWRGKGLATASIARLCDMGFSRGLEFMSLFFDNPAAGRIYQRLGFEDAGRFAMLRR